MDCIELKLTATLEQVRLATLAAASIARAYYTVETGKNCPKECHFVNTVELAVGEACTNSAKHCNPNDSEINTIRIGFEIDKTQIAVKIRDTNGPFDYQNIKTPDFALAPESGYGIHIMKSSMDEVSYHHENGWNVITLKKSIPQKETL